MPHTRMLTPFYKYVQHDKLCVHNNKFFSVNSKIGAHWPVIKCITV